MLSMKLSNEIDIILASYGFTYFYSASGYDCIYSNYDIVDCPIRGIDILFDVKDEEFEITIDNKVFLGLYSEEITIENVKELMVCLQKHIEES